MSVAVTVTVACDGCSRADTYSTDELLEDRPGRHNETIHAITAAALTAAAAQSWAAPLRLGNSPASIGEFCPDCVMSGTALEAVAEACGITTHPTDQ